MGSLISIIVPVYNSKEYLERCIDSLLKQTYSETEVILVDDGSTDGSDLICEEYAKKDQSIFFLREENSGPSCARNYGVKEANGEYVMFVDSDDYVSPDLASHLFSLIQDKPGQIGVCELSHCFDEAKVEYTKESIRKKMDPEAAICELLYQRSMTVSPCAKLFPKALFDTVTFPVGNHFEDSAIMYKLFDLSEGVVYSDAGLYAYMHREGSRTTQEFNISNCDILLVCEEIVDYFKNRSEELQKAADSYQVVGALRIYLTVPKSPEFEEPAECAKQILHSKGKKVMHDKEIRRKTKLGLMLYFYARPFMKFLHKRVNRWN